MKRFFLAIVIPLLLLTTPASADTKKYRILSVDGGGIRGVIAAQILVMLEKENPGFLENIDLFAGTSTGSIIAGFLAAGKSPQDLLDIYTTYGSQIFVPAHKDDLLHLHAKYSTEKLTELMQKIGPPGNPTLSQLKKKVVIPSVKLNNEQTGSWDPVTFDNFEYSDLPLLDAMLRSSAAPTYFPSYQGYVDGGMAATNPSMIAIAAAVDVKKGGKQPEQIHMLSLGTGTPLERIKSTSDLDWGAAEWAGINPLHDKDSGKFLILMDLLFDASIHLNDSLSAELLASRYKRVSPVLEEAINLDDWQDATKIAAEIAAWPTTRPEYWRALSAFVKENFID